MPPVLQNVTGYGIDNHMAALKLIAREHSKLAAMFNDPQFLEVFRFPLSTSQVSTSIPGTFLCYGPVVDDGYACAYNPAENSILFAIGAFKSCGKTDARQFKLALRDSLRTVQALLEE